jgi:hypothetical protein
MVTKCVGLVEVMTTLMALLTRIDIIRVEVAG